MHGYLPIPYLVLALLLPTRCYSSWAEHTLSTMSCTEKIGQLIAARVESSDSPENLLTLLMRYKVGSIIPLQYWTLAEHTALIANAKKINPKIPLLVLEDAEWGTHMHISEIPAFPKAMTLAATCNQDSLIYNVGFAIGTQCSSLGIHINLAPVLDVNSNSLNPVIGMRSFGDSEQLVTAYASAYAQGLCDAGIIPCLKHFPGHGRTHTDPHITLPILTGNMATHDKEEILCPFFNLMQSLPCAVMVGHIAYPALEPDGAIRPAIVSHSLITDLLSKKMAHNGLIISDALNMGALTEYGNTDDIALAALKAGIDILLCPPDIEAVIQRIVQALDNGEYTQQELDTHVLKILMTKESCGLHQCAVTHLKQEHNTSPLNLYKDLIQEAYDAAATAHYDFTSTRTLNNEQTSVTLGLPNTLATPLYTDTHAYEKPLRIYLYPGTYKTHRLTQEIKHTLAQIATQYPGSMVLLFGSPYCLMDIPSNLPTLVLYEDTPYTHITAEKILTGLLEPRGRLPIIL